MDVDQLRVLSSRDQIAIGGIVIVEATALMVDAAAAAIALFGEADRRRGSSRATSFAVALQHLDVSSTITSIRPATLAGLLSDGMTADHAKEVLADSEVRALVREILLVTILDDWSDELDLLSEAVATRCVVILEGRADPNGSRALGVGLAGMFCAAAGDVADAARTAAPEAFAAAQQLSQLRRISSVLESIARHANAVLRTTDQSRRGDRDAFVLEYRRLCGARHGYIQPPDFDTNQKVPIEELYVAPTIYRQLEGKHDQREEFGVLEFISRIDRTVIVGDPGGGKSTLSTFVTSTLASSASSPVPFFVTLREYAKESDGLSIVKYLETLIPSRYQLETVEGVLEDLLLTGQAMVVFDGLDELIDTTKRRQITSDVETFASRYPLAPVLVTSRRVGYEQARLDPAIFELLHIGEFSDAQVEEYVQKWFGSQTSYTDVGAKQEAASFIMQSESVPDLRSNPLMLSLMCIIFRGENFIPRKRPAIYEKCANLLFEKWDGHRHIEVPLQARDHVDAAMKFVAYRFLESGAGDTGIAYDDLVRLMTSYLYPRAMETERAAELAAIEFVDFCRGRAWVFTDAGTTAEGEPIYTFTHRTFMEYFAAVHLVRISDTPEQLGRSLLTKVAKQEWDVVAQLAVQQAEKSSDRGSERALRVMLEDKRKRTPENRGHVLGFIARCSRFAVVPPAFIGEITRGVFGYFFQWYGKDAFPNHRMSAYSPWFELDESLAEEHSLSASRALVEYVSPQLDSADLDMRAAARMLTLLAGIRHTNRSLFQHGQPKPLDVALRSICEERIDYFEALAAEEPAVWNPLAFGTLVDLDVAVDRMHEQGMSFTEIYFGPRHDFRRIPVAELSHLLSSAYAYRHGPASEEGKDFAARVASRLLIDFRSSDRVDAEPGPMRVLYSVDARHLRASRELVAAQSQTVRDALAVVWIGENSYEQVALDDHLEFRPTEPSQRTALAELLLNLDLSPDIAQFVRDWSVDAASLFVGKQNSG